MTNARSFQNASHKKSFSQQETFASDLTDEDYAEATLRRMADHLFAKVREEGRSIRTLSVRVRYNDMGEDQVGDSLDSNRPIWKRTFTGVSTRCCVKHGNGE